MGKRKLEKKKSDNKEEDSKEIIAKIPIEEPIEEVKVDKEDIDIAIKKQKIDEELSFLEGIFTELKRISLKITESKSPSKININIEKFTLKLTKLLEKNFNLSIHNIESESFPDWTKQTIAAISKKVETSSVEHYNLLITFLKLLPNSFESICDQVFPIALFNQARTKNNVISKSYLSFIKELFLTFEKLRRVPKLIAKILISIRSHFNSPELDKEADKLFVEGWGQFLLPRELDETLDPIFCYMPHSQIVDVWKILFYNFEEQCAKKISIDDTIETSTGIKMLTVVTVDLYVKFMRSIQVLDYNVPKNVIEEISELMKKLKRSLLKIREHLVNNKNWWLVKPFLNLCLTTGDLYGLLLHYNEIFPEDELQCGDDTSATNLTFLHPFLSSEEWTTLLNKVEKTGEPQCVSLTVSLVAQKLKYMTVLLQLGKRFTPSSNIKEAQVLAAKFLWERHTFLDSSCSSDVTSLASSFIDSIDVTEMSRKVVKGFPAYEADQALTVFSLKNKSQVDVNGSVHCSMIIEILVEVMRKLGKMKLEKGFNKRVTNEVLSPLNTSALITRLGNERSQLGSSKSKGELDGGGQQTKENEIIDLLLSAVNELISERSGELIHEGEEEFSGDLVMKKMDFLASLPLENYPGVMRTIVFLSASSIFISLAQAGDCDEKRQMMGLTATLMGQTGRNSQGNKILFNFNWIQFFTIIRIRAFDQDDVKRSLALTILENIYLSPQNIEGFENELEELSESFTASPQLLFSTMEFLIHKLEGEKKSKMVPFIQRHVRKLIRLVSGEMKNGGIRQLEVSFQFKAAYLLLTGMKAIGDNFTDVPGSKDAIEFELKKCIKYFSKVAPANQSKDEEKSYMNAKDNGENFLSEVCKRRNELQGELSKDFIMKLWNISLDFNDASSCSRKGTRSSLAKTIFEVSADEEFAEIGKSITEQMKNDSSDGDDKKVRQLVLILEELLKMKLEGTKGNIRRQVIQDTLYASMMMSLRWKKNESCLINLVLPTLQFQLKLIQNIEMSSLSHFAISLNSVTSAPLKDIEDTGMFMKVFCAAADLLNAFTVHRLNVISFRTHVYLQCFYYLIEALMSRSDQKGKLTDGEISDLRHCAYSIERICQSARQSKKEFSRPSPYFVAVLMRHLEMFTVYPAVKGPILSGCYKLLDLCDTHGVAQLNSMLSHGSREIFKDTYETYKKFYRFKGKV